MRLLIDTNVVLDFLQEREPFVESAAELFARIDRGEIEGFIAATTITNIYYIVRRGVGAIVAKNSVIQILSSLNICTVDQEVLEQAIKLNFQDYEDAVQYSCAIAYNLDAIVTRDLSGFVNSEIPVVLPNDLEILFPPSGL
ncbi:PIN domain-containing protein [Synechococcus sp. PCC 6312]|uniref:type II toxin-antitoxin system VapC family toxin n=1 Tax=Synechococcus sp. (strain ATCC 27167 / PCC 6312) TaxID=195253 RepID=UPI00029F41E7|nr:PIN domain-containing protein [Synechococcus sp. PCC 6312]AFY60819.1 putative nucleic acid-binding protein, contains PIN domain [Synechococcus sp. PCC 6312]